MRIQNTGIGCARTLNPSHNTGGSGLTKSLQSEVIAQVTFEKKHLTVTIKNCVSEPDLDLIGSLDLDPDPDTYRYRQKRTTKVKKIILCFKVLDVLF